MIDRLKTPKRKRLMRKIDDEDDEDDDYQPEPSAADHDDDEVMGDSGTSIRLLILQDG